VLHRLADLIEKHALNLAVLGVRDNGTEISMALKAEPGSAAGNLPLLRRGHRQGLWRDRPHRARHVLALIHREAVGVVGAIVPWNFPLMIGAWKIAPALAMGNSVVLKPAETASLTLLRLAELALEAGVPPGVFNVVTGPGRVTGEALACRRMSMCWSSPARARRAAAAGIFRPLEPETLLSGTGRQIPQHRLRRRPRPGRRRQGRRHRDLPQRRPGLRRRLAPAGRASVHDEFVADLAEATRKMAPGNPLSLATQIGAVNSLAQLEGNLGFVADATREGGQIVTGGSRALTETGGYYMDPTVVTGVRPSTAFTAKRSSARSWPSPPSTPRPRPCIWPMPPTSALPPGSGRRTSPAPTG
jgi:gamma-glutamyl-gamma-aminobutyraldehyde dehydrogenase